MYFGLFIVLVPFFAGYAIKLNHAIWHSRINTLLNRFVYLILFFMGVSLARLDNFGTHIQAIIYTTLIFFVFIFGFNFITLIGIDIFLPWRTNNATNILPSRWKMIQESLQICIALIIGFLVGLLPFTLLSHANQISQIVLILLLFIVGLQLRLNGMPLRQIIVNKIGLITTVVLLISALLGGFLAAKILGMPTKTGMALSSTFGWYSLSSILMTDTHGPLIGSVAFFNDLLRELISTLLIPTLIRRYRLTALGLCGATSLDFTLPFLQKGGGIGIVPAAIVQGFLLSLLAPILLTFLNY